MTTKIIIRATEQLDLEVDAVVRGKLAIHYDIRADSFTDKEDPDNWYYNDKSFTVSHVPTGRSIYTGMTCWQAKRLLRELATCGRWEFSDHRNISVAMRQRVRDIVEQMRQEIAAREATT